jgi:tetratricopeptide (TPR) repeat protein
MSPKTDSRHFIELPARGQAWDDAAADEAHPSLASPAADLRPDGKALVHSVTTSVARQYDVQTGASIGPPLNHSAPIVWLTYSADGETLASACADGTVRFWDAPTGQPLGPTRVHGLPVLGINFDRTGDTLSVVTLDGRAASWPVPQAVAIDDPTSLRTWTETVSGLRELEGGEVAELPFDDWHIARQQLASSWPGAAPNPDGRPELIRWCQERADDAAQLGDLNAFRWNLECLAEYHPDDWVSLARRAAAFSDAGQFAEAEAGYRRAAQVAPPQGLTSWYWYRAIDQLVSRRAELALWYFDRVIAARPDDWLAVAGRADALELLGRLSDSRLDRERALALGADPLYVDELAGELARAGDWKGAQRIVGTSGSHSGALVAARAILSLRLSDRTGYRQACSELLEQWQAQPADVDAAIRSAQVMSLAPAALDDYQPALALAAELCQFCDDPLKQPRWMRDAAHELMAILELRAGHLESAVAQMRIIAPQNRQDILGEIIGGLIDFRRGDVGAAGSHLQFAQRTLSNPSFNPVDWKDAMGLRVLEQELETAIFPADPFTKP